MKTILFLAALAAAAFLSGCAIGPNYTTVINPFDWRDVDQAPTASLTDPPPATAARVMVASTATAR